MTRLAVLLWMTAAVIAAQLAPGEWATDLSRKSIELSELRRGGPPKDGIPALNDPRFVTTSQAAIWLDRKEPVIVVEYAGEQRAYPLQILMWHELVNDRIGDLPVLVSYCPLCNSAIVFDRRLDDEVYEFGVSGMLRESDMVMFDRQTDSLWQQISGESIVGSMTGQRLHQVRSQTVSFGSFSDAFPEGTVLSRDTGHERKYGENPYVGYEFNSRFLMPVNAPRSLRAPKDRLVTVSIGETTKTYPFPFLRGRGVKHDRIGDSSYVVLFEDGTVTALGAKHIASAKEVGAAGVFRPEVDGQTLQFLRRSGQIVDRESGSRWNVLGIAVDGPLAGKRLEAVEHGVYFAFAWLVFNPDTQIVGQAGAESR